MRYRPEEDESQAQGRTHVIVLKQVNGQETRHRLDELSNEELVQMVKQLPENKE